MKHQGILNNKKIMFSAAKKDAVEEEDGEYCPLKIIFASEATKTLKTSISLNVIWHWKLQRNNVTETFAKQSIWLGNEIQHEKKKNNKEIY